MVRHKALRLLGVYVAVAASVVRAAVDPQDLRTTLGLNLPYPVFQVPVRTEDSEKIFEGADTEAFFAQRPWARSKVDPFYYEADIRAAEHPDAQHIFLVGGLNCTSTILNSKTLTGIPWSLLQLRAAYGACDDPKMRGVSGSNPYMFTPRDKLPPEWKSINNLSMRILSEGYLAEKETLRQRLVEDNDYVLSKGLTHQELAEPLLLAVQAVTNAHFAGKAMWKERFVFNGRNYTVSRLPMGRTVGDEAVHPKLAMAMDKNLSLALATRQYEDAIRLSPKNRSGWIGAGIRGSFFQDELFASWLARIEDGMGGALLLDALTPHFIHRYGFYQGGPYRVTPQSIISLFSLKGASPSPVSKCGQLDAKRLERERSTANDAPFVQNLFGRNKSM